MSSFSSLAVLGLKKKILFKNILNKRRKSLLRNRDKMVMVQLQLSVFMVVASYCFKDLLEHKTPLENYASKAKSSLFSFSSCCSTFLQILQSVKMSSLKNWSWSYSGAKAEQSCMFHVYLKSIVCESRKNFSSLLLLHDMSLERHLDSI